MSIVADADGALKPYFKPTLVELSDGDGDVEPLI